MQSTALYLSCPVCSGELLKHLWDVNGYAITRCSSCMLVFVQNKVTLAELAQHYSGPKDSVYEDDNADCLDYYYQKLGDLIKKRFPKEGRILDLGCSQGWFLDVMTGWECHGNEIVPGDAAAARERFGSRIVTGSFEEYPLREGFFDVITLQDVFDHMRDPLNVLNKCHRMLRPGGMIVIKVHNISCLYARLSGAGFYAIIPPSHLFYYDPKTLALALARSGFQVEDSKFIGHLLKLKTIFWRLSRNDMRSPFLRVYRALNGTRLGEFKIHKNLHDIFTMFAVKR